jgi:hypothetical protein
VRGSTAFLALLAGYRQERRNASAPPAATITTANNAPIATNGSESAPGPSPVSGKIAGGGLTGVTGVNGGVSGMGSAVAVPDATLE